MMENEHTATRTYLHVDDEEGRPPPGGRGRGRGRGRGSRRRHSRARGFELVQDLLRCANPREALEVVSGPGLRRGRAAEHGVGCVGDDVPARSVCAWREMMQRK